MVITVLLENVSLRETLTAEHGLSLHIEAAGHRILFDTGASDAFARNADVLGIDLRSVDFAVLSHGHYDHGGGLSAFRQRSDAPVYLRREAFGAHRNALGKYIGLDPALNRDPNLLFPDELHTLAPGITLWGPEPGKHAIDSAGLTAGDPPQPDSFLHEQYLLVEEEGKRICFSGCSHRGIRNIAERFRPDILIGGFHFMKLDPEGVEDRRRLEEAANALLALPTVYYTGHCTGQAAYDFLKARMGDRLHSIHTGDIIRL